MSVNKHELVTQDKIGMAHGGPSFALRLKTHKRLRLKAQGSKHQYFSPGRDIALKSAQVSSRPRLGELILYFYNFIHFFSLEYHFRIKKDIYIYIYI